MCPPASDLTDDFLDGVFTTGAGKKYSAPRFLRKISQDSPCCARACEPNDKHNANDKCFT
jgi:hypothetical protein